MLIPSDRQRITHLCLGWSLSWRYVTTVSVLVYAMVVLVYFRWWTDDQMIHRRHSDQINVRLRSRMASRISEEGSQTDTDSSKGQGQTDVKGSNSLPNSGKGGIVQGDEAKDFEYVDQGDLMGIISKMFSSPKRSKEQNLVNNNQNRETEKNDYSEGSVEIEETKGEETYKNDEKSTAKQISQTEGTSISGSRSISKSKQQNSETPDKDTAFIDTNYISNVIPSEMEESDVFKGNVYNLDVTQLRKQNINDLAENTADINTNLDLKSNSKLTSSASISNDNDSERVDNLKEETRPSDIEALKKSTDKRGNDVRGMGQSANTGSSKVIVGGQKVKLVKFLNPMPGGTRIVTFSSCAYKCKTINSTQDADLLVINAGQMNNVDKLPKRPPSQIWLMHSREAAAFGRFRYLQRDDIRGVVNWTASIYSDTTFTVKHGELQKRDLPERDYNAIFDRKRAEAAWFVSHCETSSKREDYVTRLRRYVDVDIFGRCGNLTCGGRGYTMGGDLQECMKMLSTTYKFYLAFENALCENYLTEKFFNLFRADVDIIPVVRTGADYSKRFPKDILIDTRDFKGPEELGRYLRQLSTDKTRYVKLLKNKSRYMMRKKFVLHCGMCEAIHTGTLPVQVVDDPYQIWGNETRRCHKPRDLGGGY